MNYEVREFLGFSQLITIYGKVIKVRATNLFVLVAAKLGLRFTNEMKNLAMNQSVDRVVKVETFSREV